MTSTPTQAYKLLVTARHLVDPKWAGCGIANASQQIPKIFMRLNKKDYDPAKDAKGTVDVLLDDGVVAAKTWFISEDQAVDAAVLLLNGKALAPYDVGAVNIWDFPTEEEMKLFSPGDAIVSAGLLPGASGRNRNYPIFKFGNISSIPDELADAPTCPGGGSPSHMLRLWFVAASLVPGNSGSPIYYVPPGFGGLSVGGANPRPVLLGIQSMSFLPWDVAGMTPIPNAYKIIKDMKLQDANLSLGPRPVTDKLPSEGK
jgi:hypothetical protein